jgi:hypothetical protein
MLQRIVLWVETTNRTAPQILNGGASIPGGGANAPEHREHLHDWFKSGWRVHGASTYLAGPVGPGDLSEIQREITVLVLEHD